MSLESAAVLRGRAVTRPGRSARWRRKRDRPSRWDRPPEPRDWRHYVGTVGRILVAVGLLLFGFVAYQLWGTGIETAQAQRRLESQFDEYLDRAGQPEVRVGAPTVSPATAGTSPDQKARVQAGLPAADPFLPPLPPVIRGRPLALLEIPATGLSVYVVPGVGVADLKLGPGHYPGTPLPGQLGNAALAGHRTTYGAPFFDIDDIQPGDEIITTLANGNRYVYEMTASEVVRPSDSWVINTIDPTTAQITLTSCEPKWIAERRIIVRGVLNEEKSAPVGDATFYDLDVDAGTSAGTPPTAPAPAAPSTQPEPDQPAPEAEGDELGRDSVLPNGSRSLEAGRSHQREAALDVSEQNSPSTAFQPPPDPVSIEMEAFENGWFGDPAAFVQISLWGLVLSTVALLSRRASRRYRSDLAGLAIASAPFLVSLYFFYQNISRLLPPGY